MPEILRLLHLSSRPHSISPGEIGANLRMSHEGQGLSQKEILASIDQAAAQKGADRTAVLHGYVSQNLQIYFGLPDTRQ